MISGHQLRNDPVVLFPAKQLPVVDSVRVVQVKQFYLGRSKSETRGCLWDGQGFFRDSIFECLYVLREGAMRLNRFTLFLKFTVGVIQVLATRRSTRPVAFYGTAVKFFNQAANPVLAL